MLRPILKERRSRINSWLWLTVFFLGSTALASLPTSQEVEEALTYQCSCDLTIHSCNHLQCGFVAPAKHAIAERATIDWHFTTQEARIKLHRLYPSPLMR